MLELACVMAHEVGHIMQYKKNFLSSWVIKNELSADYLAGWYIAKTRRLNRQSVENLSGWFKEIGDIAFTEEDHHGTPWQRSKIFMRGAGIVGDEFSEGEGRDVLSPDDSISEAFTNALSITGADGG